MGRRQRPVTINTTVYAYIMEVQSYMVKFDANGGTGTMEDQKFAASDEKALSLNSFVKEGFRFIGWAYDGDLYADGQVVKLLTLDGGEIVLTAVWEKADELSNNGGFDTAEKFVLSDNGNEFIRSTGRRIQIIIPPSTPPRLLMAFWKSTLQRKQPQKRLTFMSLRSLI